MRFQNSMNREVIHKMKETKIRRGDIFSYDFGTRIGSIQSGVRPVLVIQADNFNTNAPTVIVASITSVIKKEVFAIPHYFRRGFRSDEAFNGVA